MTFHWTQLQNIMRDPFEKAVGEEQKSAMSRSAVRWPPRARRIMYDWNILPIGQMLWQKELSPTSTSRRSRCRRATTSRQVLEQVKKQSNSNPGQ